MVNLPFVPDLIKEESQAFALYLMTSGGNIGRLCVSGLTAMLSKHLSALNAVLYSYVSISFGYIILVAFGMKDVVNEKEFDISRERSGSTTGKARAWFVVKQGLKVIWEEPQIFYAVTGAVI